MNQSTPAARSLRSEQVTDAIAELDEAVGELNAVLTLLENGNGNRNSGRREAGR